MSTVSIGTKHVGNKRAEHATRPPVASQRTCNRMLRKFKLVQLFSCSEICCDARQGNPNELQDATSMKFQAQPAIAEV